MLGSMGKEELWELDLFGCLPLAAAPSPALSAGAEQHHGLLSAPWQETELLGWSASLIFNAGGLTSLG